LLALLTPAGWLETPEVGDMNTIAGVHGARRHELTDYQRHLDLFGSECVVETACGDLSDRELGELVALVKHKQRVGVFRHGQWVGHGQEIRVCESCGKDLPRGASRRMRRHSHCRERDKRARQRKSDS
jgi:hypothetical protein